jgi:hypothetical protein
MNTSFAQENHERIAGMVWRCWRTLGAPAKAMPVRRTIIDPEALVVLTAWIARSGEDRMTAVAADWCRENHGLLSHIRLRQLAHPDDPELAIEVARLVALANGQESQNWASVKFTTKPNLDAQPSVQIRIGDPAMLRMRLRALMGPTARAEALAVLLSSPVGGGGTTSAALARSTLFGQRNLRAALNDLAYGGWINQWRVGARQLRYEISESSLEAFGPQAVWVDWVDRLLALVALTRAAEALETATISAVANVIEHVSRAEPSLRSSGITVADWYAADSPEGIERVKWWIADAVWRLTQVE